MFQMCETLEGRRMFSNNITYAFDANVSSVIRTACNQADSWWDPHVEGKNITIHVHVADIDGKGGILAQTNIGGSDPNMTWDTATNQDATTMYHIAVHETGHALGIGPHTVDTVMAANISNFKFVVNQDQQDILESKGWTLVGF